MVLTQIKELKQPCISTLTTGGTVRHTHRLRRWLYILAVLAGNIKPEHKYFKDKCQSIRLTDNSAGAEPAQDNSSPIMRRRPFETTGDICLNFAPPQFCCYHYLDRIAI